MILFIFYKFLLGNIHYTGERVIETIPIRLILYIIYIAPIVSPPQPLPTPLKAIVRFLSSISYRHMKSFYHILSPWSPSFTLPCPTGTPCPVHTVPFLQSWFLLLILRLTFKGVTQCMPSVGVLYFGLFNPFEGRVSKVYDFKKLLWDGLKSPSPP
jgi:hypothetical protein